MPLEDFGLLSDWAATIKKTLWGEKMNIPILKRSDRKREYEYFSTEQHQAVVEAYLFKGMSHRQIERNILGLDSDYFRGYRSMSILKYLGIENEFKGLFRGMTVAQAIAELKQVTNADYEDIIAILSGKEISETKCEEDIQSETAIDYRSAKEGRCELVYTTRYERSPILRKRAIQIHGTTCMACEFNFYKFYGARGKDYIEVHHLIPLSTLEEEFEINPVTDMAVVCSNCHRMIHRDKNDILSIDELKEIINQNRLCPCRYS